MIANPVGPYTVAMGLGGTDVNGADRNSRGLITFMVGATTHIPGVGGGGAKDNASCAVGGGAGGTNSGGTPPVSFVG